MSATAAATKAASVSLRRYLWIQTIEEILRSKPSEREIAEAAKPQAIPTMAQDGIIKVLRGVTSLDELRRVVDLAAKISGGTNAARR